MQFGSSCSCGITSNEHPNTQCWNGKNILLFMATIKKIATPLFDTIDSLREPIPAYITDYLAAIAIPEAQNEFNLGLRFLESYSGSLDTFNAYRREIEKFFHWCWLITQKPIKNIDRDDIRAYFEFTKKPPLTWISTKNAARFVDNQGVKIPNPEWRPFVVKISKAKHKNGEHPDKQNYLLSNKSLAALIAILSTFFTFLEQENYINSNPVQLVRQKNRYIQKHQSQKITRKLSLLQWQFVIETAEQMANTNTEYERHLFLMSIFYLLGLRISEVATNSHYIPIMGNFAPDKHSRWWFTTIGKGNKVRDIAVPDTLLDSLKRYRLSLNLSPLPTRGETTPLLAKSRGMGNIGIRQVRNLVQTCFDRAIYRLRQAGKEDEAQDLETATVHWLRHTAISADVEHRPREHVRDDAGHESAVITDRYIDIDRIARHNSAKNKQLKPGNINNAPTT
jgi:site-specific recombinase XerD